MEITQHELGSPVLLGLANRITPSLYAQSPLINTDQVALLVVVREGADRGSSAYDFSGSNHITMAGRKLVIVYDVVSPYSLLGFLTATRYRKELADHGISLVLKPFFLGGIMKGAGNRPPLTVPAKVGRGSARTALHRAAFHAPAPTCWLNSGTRAISEWFHRSCGRLARVGPPGRTGRTHACESRALSRQGAYMLKDLADLGPLFGVKLQLPSNFPMNTLPAQARSAAAALALADGSSDSHVQRLLAATSLSQQKHLEALSRELFRGACAPPPHTHTACKRARLTREATGPP
jgi:2-hydroxychromene-2-carboxylate isomerase